MGAFELVITEGNYENKDAVDNVIKYDCRLNKPYPYGGQYGGLYEW